MGRTSRKNDPHSKPKSFDPRYPVTAIDRPLKMVGAPFNRPLIKLAEKKKKKL